MCVFDHGHVHHLAFSLNVAGAYVYSQIVNLMPNFGIAQNDLVKITGTYT